MRDQRYCPKRRHGTPRRSGRADRSSEGDRLVFVPDGTVHRPVHLLQGFGRGIVLCSLCLGNGELEIRPRVFGKPW